ncbi:unnamed protein product, partial [Linum tenue]
VEQPQPQVVEKPRKTLRIAEPTVQAAKQLPATPQLSAAQQLTLALSEPEATVSRPARRGGDGAGSSSGTSATTPPVSAVPPSATVHQVRDVRIHTAAACNLVSANHALRAIGPILSVPPRVEKTDPLHDLAQIHFAGLSATFRAQQERASMRAKMKADEAQIVQLEGKVLGANNRAEDATSKANEALESLGLLQSRLAADVEAAKEQVRNEERTALREELEVSFSERLRKAREEFQKEKDDLVRLHTVAKAEAVRAAEVAAVRQFKSSQPFGKIMADAMTKAVIAVGKKIRPENPGMRWDTREMVQHVKVWISEKRPLDSDSESEEEEEEEVERREEVERPTGEERKDGEVADEDEEDEEEERPLLRRKLSREG